MRNLDLDSALIGLHQRLVDALQLQPLWLARVCAVVYALCLAAWLLLVDRSPMQQGGVALALVVVWLDVRSPLALAKAGTFAFLRLGLVVGSVALAVLSVLHPTPTISLQQLSVAALVSLLYFAACRPPSPRLPRRSVSLSGASGHA